MSMFDVDDTSVGSEMSNLLMVFLRNNSPFGFPRGTEGMGDVFALWKAGLIAGALAPVGGDIIAVLGVDPCD